jgi:hypothetical protein
MQVSFSPDALGAFLCDRGVSAPLGSFPTFEINVISPGFYLRPSSIPPRLGPSNQQDSNDHHRDNDNHK